MSLSPAALALAEKLERVGAANPASIKAVENELRFSFPPGYADFASLADGAEGFVGEAYLSMWPVNRLVALNAMVNVSRFAPGMVLFATDGGTQAYAFDGRQTPVSIVEVHIVTLRWSEATPLATDFEAFLRHLSGDQLISTSRPRLDLLRHNTWEVHPIVLGGSPEDPKNRQVVGLETMLQFAAYWNDVILRMDEQERGQVR